MMLKQQTGADVFSIITEQQYSPNYDDGVIEHRIFVVNCHKCTRDPHGCQPQQETRESDISAWLSKNEIK